MSHLSGVGASFLHLKTLELPMHVGSLQIAGAVDAAPIARRRSAERTTAARAAAR